LWLVQSAFSAGPLHASLPAITAAEPLAGITLGVLVFGDVVHITPWLLALQAAGLATMFAGTVLVARAPMFVRLSLDPAAEHHHPPKLPAPVGPSADDGEPPARGSSEAPSPQRIVMEPPPAPDPVGRAGQDTTVTATPRTNSRHVADMALPGIQGTGIKELGLAGVRIPWHLLAALAETPLKAIRAIKALKAAKVPQPPAAQ